MNIRNLYHLALGACGGAGFFDHRFFIGFVMIAGAGYFLNKYYTVG